MNADLFPELIPIRAKRAKPRVLMHVSDASDVSIGDPKDFGKPLCKMTCHRCGAESEWLIFETVTEAKRGIPCEACNRPDADN